MTDERRLHSRIPFQSSSATLVLADRRADVRVLDLSLKGALVRLPADQAKPGLGAPCTLQLRLNDATADVDIALQGRIAHTDNDCVGIACLTIDLDSITHLRRLVELNLGDSTLLERELSALVADSPR